MAINKGVLLKSWLESKAEKKWKDGRGLQDKQDGAGLCLGDVSFHRSAFEWDLCSHARLKQLEAPLVQFGVHPDCRP